MTSHARHRIAAAGAAAILSTVGAVAAMHGVPAVGWPNAADALSGRTASAPSDVVQIDEPITVDSISEADFDSHWHTEDPFTNCDQSASLKYCEYPVAGSNGITWDAYVAIPPGTTLDATFDIDCPDGQGNHWKLDDTVHIDQPYVHLSAAWSGSSQRTIQTKGKFTLSDGSQYAPSVVWALQNGQYSGMVDL